MNHINKIKDLEKKLKDEVLKNQKLENEKKELKEKVDKITQEKINEINSLKMQLDNYKSENQKLNDEISNNNKIISNLQLNQIGINEKNNEIINLKNEIINLKEKLFSKETEINQLKISHNNNDKEHKYDQNELMVLNFVSTETPLIQNCGIACFPNETFAEVEEKV